MHPNLITELLPNDAFFDMIKVEGGTFLMGNESAEAYNREKPAHQVELSDFYIGKYPVTQALWQSVMDDNPSYHTGKNLPVDTVSWLEVQAFIAKLNALTSHSDGLAYRLPTEAEWEYAARGGKLEEGFTYAGSDDLSEVGWFNENSYGESRPVGLLEPNELGIYDLSGNVYEWCQDWYSRMYYQSCHTAGTVKNPRGPKFGAGRVVRGGYWFGEASVCDCRFRLNFEPDSRFLFLGFRLVLA